MFLEVGIAAYPALLIGPVPQLAAEGGAGLAVELVGFGPTAGLLVKAMPVSPWIAPQRTKGQRPLG